MNDASGLQLAELEGHKLLHPKLPVGHVLDSGFEFLKVCCPNLDSNTESCRLNVQIDYASVVAVVQQVLPEVFSGTRQFSKPGVAPFVGFGEAFHGGNEVSVLPPRCE